MKIVYLSDSAIPSTSPNSVHVMKMCQAFAELGHEVILLGKNTTACLRNVRDIYAFYSVENNFKLQIFPRTAFKGSGTYYNISLAWRVMDIQADVIYTRSITAAFFLLLFHKAVVFEVHEPFESKGIRLKNMFRFIVQNKKLTKLVVISDALKEYYLSNFAMQENRVFVAHDGADLFPSVSPILTDNEFKIGYVGSLYPGKGMEILIPLAHACKHVRFHIVGGNKIQIRECTKNANAMEVSNMVFHGFKSQQELPGYIASFDAVIAPYTSYVKVSEKKGANNLALWMSPLKIFEYMSAKKPIIASDLPVIREILVHEVTALLCSPDILNTWIEAIQRISHDKILRENLSKASLLEFKQKYTWKKRAEHLLNVITGS